MEEKAAKHTPTPWMFPTPWAAEDDLIVCPSIQGDDARVIAATYCGEGHADTAPAVSVHNVKCVNAHDELVAALEKILEAGVCGAEDSTQREAHDSARATLAKVIS